MNPEQFVKKWAGIQLKESASYVSHFEDVCRLVGHPLPADIDKIGEKFTYQRYVTKSTGRRGFADVWYDGRFAIEYKGIDEYPDLNAAYQQLLQYREKLKNPPLLVVTDIANWEIHTNWPNSEKKVYSFTNDEIASRSIVMRWLRELFYEPDKLHPDRNTDAVTKEAARGFQLLADNMRGFQTAPEGIAHFLTKLIFCLFAEDIGLLPSARHSPRGIFNEIIETTAGDPPRFSQYTEDLFRAMAHGGDVLLQKIPFFNGNLFDDIHVERLTNTALRNLKDAANLNWQSVEPSIFGTLFERSLDPAKRAQLGAHYTSRDDIMLIVEPVLMKPLRRKWQAIKDKAAPLRQKYDAATTGSEKYEYSEPLVALRDDMLHTLRTTSVLDPACGSGNFLYVALRQLLDLEKEVIKHDLFAGLDDEPEPQVHPKQLYGIEKDPIAHSLASIVVWIGYLQWMYDNGYWRYWRHEGGIGETRPILTRLADNIKLMDAILAFDENGNPIEPEWPAVDVIVGNPPFLGRHKLRSELGDEYTDKLFSLYTHRVPGSADLVTYWFERARQQLENDKVQRIGLLATNSIRGGANREVLDRIKQSGDIFMAWADREWILDGAAVRVSMVGFDDGLEEERYLDGLPATMINSDLTSSVDITVAHILDENTNLAFIGPQKDGPLDIPNELAQEFLASKNRSGLNNVDVLKPYLNGRDITQNSRNYWILDFNSMEQDEAAQYEAPFEYVLQNLKPLRAKNRDRQRRENWWRLGRSGGDYREASEGITRQIFSPRVAKHRVFIWVDENVFPDSAVVAIARDDDYFLGVLHSTLHEVWSLRMGSSLEDRPRYTPTTTFETFPFPWSPGQEPLDDPRYQAIADAARQLHEERDAWLNGTDIVSTDSKERAIQLKDRTLTNLYNALAVWRGLDSMKTKPDARDFAIRLDELHQQLDLAVCDAYEWPHDVLDEEEEMLRRLLALNLARAGKKTEEN